VHASRSRFLTLAAAAILSLANWAVPALAVDYCVYHIVSGFAGLTPELNAGDIICVDCPTSGVCPGPTGTVFTATIRDGGGTEADGRLRKADPSCFACPSGGKTGYTFVKVPKVSLVEEDIDWTTEGNLVRFHLTFRNTDPDTVSEPSAFDVFVQNAYGTHLLDGPSIFSGNVPPMPVGSFFDVFFDIPLDQLPPPPARMFGSVAKDGTVSAAPPCGPGAIWSGNVDVVWSGPGGAGMVGKHLGGLLVTPGGAIQYIHVLTGCATSISWTFGPGCSGFSTSLVNEDFSPAPASLPPAWTGWIAVSAAASVTPGTACCFYIDMTCGFVPARIDLCATACDQATAPLRRSWSEVKAFYR
jgi:hypothetical protein